jgi:hypothetical protein
MNIRCSLRSGRKLCACALILMFLGCAKDYSPTEVTREPEPVAIGFQQGTSSSDSVIVNSLYAAATGPFCLSPYSSLRISFTATTLYGPGQLATFSWGMAARPMITDTLSSRKTREYVKYVYFFQISRPDSVVFTFSCGQNELVQFSDFKILGWR